MARAFPSGGHLARRRSCLVLGLGLLTLLCWAIDRQDGLNAAFLAWWSDGVWTLLALFSAFWCQRAARVSSGSDGIAWRLFALGCLFWAGGMILWDWNELVLGIATPFPSLGDGGFLGLALLFAAGLLFYRPTVTARGLMMVQTGNLLVIASAMLVVMPLAFYGLILRDGLGPLSGHLPYIATALAYPVFYGTALLFGVYNAIFYSWGRKRFIITLLILAILAHAAVDLLYCRALLGHAYQDGARYDFLWVLSFALICWAAFEQAAAAARARQAGEAAETAAPGAAEMTAEQLGVVEAFIAPLAILAIVLTSVLFYRDMGPQIILVAAILGLSFPVALGFKEWAMHRLQRGLRRKADASLAEIRHSEERYRALFASIRDGILLFRPDRAILSANAAACRMFGYEEAELLGRHYSLIMDMADPRLKLALRERARTGHFEGELTMVRKDGSRFPVDISSSIFGAGSEPFACVVVRDISERVRVYAELVSAKEQAEAGSRAKSQFLAHMSHELRTPLNAIIGFSEMMAGRVHGPLGAPKYDEYAGHVLSSGRHLLSIINDILDLAKVEAGKYELVSSEIEIADFLCGLVQLYTDRVAAAGLVIALHAAPDLPNLVADARLLRQVLLNLLSNAVKFTPAGGSIAVSAALLAEGGLEIGIEDTGAGIAEEDLPRVLLPFGQAKAGIARPYEGTGLGLPLAKAFLELHGGTLELASRLGQGTRVRVRLPAERLRERARRQAGSA